MKILTVLTYYRPHTSGLTIYAERLAQAFAKRGHEVTVMTTQYDKSLPREEMMDGVDATVPRPVTAQGLISALDRLSGSGFDSEMAEGNLCTT